jgi:hypothetical protein
MIIGERAISYLSISKIRYLKFANKNKQHRNLKVRGISANTNEEDERGVVKS